MRKPRTSVYQRRDRSKSSGDSNTRLDSTSMLLTLRHYVRPSMELLLIRHGLPYRVEMEEGTAADPELDDTGHAQAEALADFLTAEHIDILVASPLRRALQTAEHVAARTGHEVLVDEEL